MLFAFVWCWKGDESLFGRLGGAGSYWLVEERVIFKETLKARLVHRGGMCYEVLTSGVQFAGLSAQALPWVHLCWDRS